MRKYLLFSVGVLSLVSMSLAADDPNAVKVTKRAPTLAYRQFDPRKPPRDMPLFVPGEAGLCHYEYTLSVGVSSDVEELSPGKVKLTYDGIDVEASLPITIWLETKAPQRIKEHELGHKAISEYYYQNIDVYSRRVAKSWIGKSQIGEGKDKQSAIKDANNKAIAAINEAILADTRVRAVAANDRYDKRTDHSRNPGSQDEAVKATEAEDPEPAGGKPEAATTAPAASAQ